MILPNVKLDTAVRIAERARVAIEATPFTIGDDTVRVTASFGVAERAEGEARDAVIARADEAMYRAKQAGRNRVASAG